MDRAQPRPCWQGHDIDSPTPGGGGLQAASTEILTPPSYRNASLSSSLPHRDSPSIFVPSCLTFHRTCFMVRVKWPSELQGGGSRRGWRVILRTRCQLEVVAVILPPCAFCTVFQTPAVDTNFPGSAAARLQTSVR